MLSQEISNRSNKLIECRRATFDATRGSVQQKPHSKDVNLVERLRRGDDTAYEEFVQTFGGRLLSTARRFLTVEDDARDALQNAFLSAVKAIHNFKGDSQLSTWLHRIVVNSALEILREKRRRAESQQVQIDELLPQFEADASWPNDRVGEIPTHVVFEASETRALVRKCIDQLPDRYRVVLMLRDIEEFDTDEVASMLGLTQSNVKVRLHRARQALKTLIEREGIAR